MTEDPQVHVRAFIRGLVEATITQEDERDRQVLPGPSDLADPCDLCVARKIAAACGIHLTSAHRTFSLKAWNGTAVHQKLERDLPQVYPHAEREITVIIEDIEGLGVIKGHVDLYVPEVSAMSDYKTTDLRKLAVYRSSGVPTSHVGQTMLYLYGLRKSGRKADWATLTYIPRDSNKKEDIWVASCPYRHDIAVGLLNRTRQLLERVRSGKTDWFRSDPGCFVCPPQDQFR